MVARAIHNLSPRREKPFIAVNCASIPATLIESEIFGHERGAFTGADQRRPGVFELAHGGTLFLDEVGEIPIELQAKLLRVLEEGRLRRLGGKVEIEVDVRVLCATNRDLKAEIKNQRFREDLYFRLNVVPIRLPPLRERLDDIPDLVAHFLDQAVARGLPRKTLDRDALERLKRHRWPGNVRELENLVQRMAAVYVEDVIGADAVEAELSGQRSERATTLAVPETTSLAAFTEAWLQGYFAGFAPELPPPGIHQRMIREVEAPMILAALAATGGNQLRAAELLGINRNTLRSRIRDLGINLRQARQPA
jgi:two-component system nitrogen regulation response regulator GlnG